MSTVYVVLTARSGTCQSRHMTDSVSVDVVRVFCTADGRLGNDLGVIRGSTATLGVEQRIAARLGFSETIFLGAVTAEVAAVSIFTPATELPFAGHPSVGAAWWLARSGTPVLALKEKAGVVDVRVDGEIVWISARPRWAPEFQWHPLPTPAAVDELDSDAFTYGQHYAYAWIDESEGTLRARMFAPQMGIREDQATGAAAVRIADRLGRDVLITQGAGSQLHARRLADGRVEVGGRTRFDRTIELDLADVS